MRLAVRINPVFFMRPSLKNHVIQAQRPVLSLIIKAVSLCIQTFFKESKHLNFRPPSGAHSGGWEGFGEDEGQPVL